MVVVGVLGGIKEGRIFSVEMVCQPIDRRPVRLQLVGITFAKFCPFGLLMIEPSTQIGARSNIFRPIVDFGIAPLQSARPQPIDENADTVAIRPGLVNSLYLQEHC